MSRRSLRKLLRSLVHEHSEPWRIGAAVALGIFIGVQPLYGLHLGICIAAAWLLGLNKLLTYAAANISIPPMIPLIVFAELQLGHKLRTGEFIDSPREDLLAQGAQAAAKAALADTFVGAVILGLGIGLPAGAAVWLWARAAARDKHKDAARLLAPLNDAEDAALLDARAAYAGCHPRVRIFLRIKTALDPLPMACLRLVGPDHRVLDLGCGYGFLAQLRRSSGHSGVTVGLDWDEEKIEAAHQAAAGDARLRFDAAKLPGPELPVSDRVIVADLLHYLPDEDRERLVEEVIEATAPGGALILRDMDASRRSAPHRLVENLGRAVGQNRGERVEPLDFSALAERLRTAGFQVRSFPFTRLPGSTDRLLIAERVPEP